MIKQVVTHSTRFEERKRHRLPVRPPYPGATIQMLLLAPLVHHKGAWVTTDAHHHGANPGFFCPCRYPSATANLNHTRYEKHPSDELPHKGPPSHPWTGSIARR